MTTVSGLLNRVTSEILNPLLTLLFVLATVLFLWGVVQYVIGGQGNAGKLEKARSAILYGLLGMFIMGSAWSIVGVLQRFFQ